MAHSKLYEYKVFDKNYQLITSWRDATFDSFNAKLNSGLGELLITLARKFDDFDEGVSVKNGNIVEVWVKDAESPGRRIYSGYIAGYSPVINGINEYVEVTLLGFLTIYAVLLYKDGTTVSVAQNSTDPADMVKSAVDRAQLEYAGDGLATRIAYDSNSIPILTGTTASYTFTSETNLEVIQRAQELAPAGWNFYLGPDNLLQFGQAAAQPKHTFTFKKDFTQLRVYKNMEHVRNSILLWNGRHLDDAEVLSRFYTDATSIAEFGNRIDIATDGRVSLSDTMDKWGNAFITSNKNEDLRTTIKIVDSNVQTNQGYDIDSISPGDTCRFNNLPSTAASTFNFNMLVVSMAYFHNYAILEIESQVNNTARNLAQIKRDLTQQQYDTGQPPYTVV